MEKKKVYQNWWFWLIVSILVILGCIGGIMDHLENTENVETMVVNNYMSSYEWNLKDTKTGKITFNDNSTEEYKYVVLGVENQEGDLEARKIYN